MTTTTPKPRNHLALWAGLTTLFTNFAALNLLTLLGDPDNPYVKLIVALVTAVAAAAAVYARQHLADAKAQRQ